MLRKKKQTWHLFTYVYTFLPGKSAWRIIPWYVLGCPPTVKPSRTGKGNVHIWEMKRLYETSCSSEALYRPSVFGIHISFASKTKDKIITIIKQAAGKHRSLWFREIRLPNLLSLKYVIWKKIIAVFQSCFSTNAGCLISSSFTHLHGCCEI